MDNEGRLYDQGAAVRQNGRSVFVADLRIGDQFFESGQNWLVRGIRSVGADDIHVDVIAA
jgi:hypothetical protein